MRTVIKQIIKWYCFYLPFPGRGEKFFSFLLKKFELEKESFVKRTADELFMEVNAYDHIERQLLWYGTYEQKESRTIKTLLSAQSVFVDIGANIGYYSLLAGKKITSGQVYSFEPVTHIYKKLLRNVSLNSMNSVFCIQAAISNSTGSTTIFISGDDNSGMSGLQSAENFSGKTETVRSITLDEAVTEYNIPKIDIIKIDVEGAEVKVLKGMELVMQLQQPVILIEISVATLSMHNEKIETVFELLFSKGYSAFAVSDVNVLKKVLNPQEADMMFFFPKNFIAPTSIRFIN